MRLEDCPVRHTLEFIGGKWKPIILNSLKIGTKRSSELSREVSQASGKVLTQQLRELERDGILQRKIYPTTPPQVEYSLTKLGRSLRPALKALAEWGQNHKHETGRKM